MTGAVDGYLLQGKLPATGKVCRGDNQPFEGDPEELEANAVRQQALRQLKGETAIHR